MTVRPVVVYGGDSIQQQIQAGDQAIIGDVAVVSPPITGQSITLTAYRTVLNDTVAIATLTLAFPATPADRQTHYVTTRTAVAALTMTASNVIGALPTTLTSGATVGWQYVASIGTWVRIQ